MQQREEAAAEEFLQHIMRIRGASKHEVLKDAALVFFQAVNWELKSNTTKARKRKFASALADTETLRAVVNNSFAKLESEGANKEAFRVHKFRKTD